MKNTFFPIVAAFASATLSAPAAAGPSGEVRIVQYDSSGVFSFTSCQVDPYNQAVVLRSVRARSGIPAGDYSFDCKGISVEATFNERIPHSDFEQIVFDGRLKRVSYQLKVSNNTSPDPQSSTVGNKTYQPAFDPNHDPRCIAAMRNVTVSGDGAMASKGPWVKTGTGLCYKAF